MINILKRLQSFANFITATMLAVLFFTFLCKYFHGIFLKHHLDGLWTLLNTLVMDSFFWLLFCGSRPGSCQIWYLLLCHAKKVQLIFSIISAIGVIVIMGYSFLPTIDYIDWMKMRKTTTVKIFNNKIPLSYIFSVYGIFLYQ